MPKQNKDTGKHLIRAQFVPSTMNAEKRTVDVTFATDTPVLRYSWRYDEYYNEVLDMKGAKLERAKNGLPVLDNHGRWGSVGDILGRAENVRIENGQGTATIRFSKRDNIKDIVSDVEDNIIRDISFGYSVTKYERMEKAENADYRDYIAREWEPNEISFVTIPADPKAGVRGEGDESPEPEIIDNQNRGLDQNMTEAEKKALRDAERQRAADITGAVAVAGLSAEFARSLIDNEAMTVEAARAAITAEQERVSNDPTKAREEGAKAERARSKAITDAVRSAGLGEDFARTLIDEGKSIDQAREAIIAKWAEGDPNKGTRGQNPTVGEDRNRTLEIASGEAALIMRAAPDLVRSNPAMFDKETITAANGKRHLRLLDMAKDALVRAGERVEGLSPMEIVARAFTSSSSDFPVLLEGTNRRILLANYNAVADTWRKFCAVGSVSDFREYKRLRMGTFSDLDSVQENGEFKNKKITDADYEKVSIETFGNLINVSRKMIINDDLTAFTRLSSMLGRAAARSIENDVYAFLASNPVLQDGKALFHVDHNNIAETAGAPSITVLEAMRVQMAQHMDKDKNDYLDIRPNLVLAPLSLGGPLRILNGAQYDPDSTGKFQLPNIVNGLFNEVIDTPRLSGTAYYAFANPNEEPALEVNFLDGVETPFMESENGFEIDGVTWKIRLDYGVGAVGFRGIMKNAGAQFIGGGQPLPILT